MFKNVLIVPLIAALAGCVSSTADQAAKTPSFADEESATVLMTVGEGWAFQSGQAFAVLSGAGESYTLRSMTDRRGGPGSADLVVGKNKAYELNAISVKPGAYAITNWGFRMRRGRATDRQTKSVNLAAGEVYYLGSFYANNFTQTTKIYDRWGAEQANYLSKFPELNGKPVKNVSGTLNTPCWKMDVTDELAKGSPVIQKTLKGCR
ncbi:MULTISPECIES: hypothetical protein [unclassified Roseovarius]|uniref:hypothetical protein n=1 Tax=unclassified Roseovarius TaxID=2614913 RepID=UPI00273F6ED2|nr:MULTISPECIES: hypothetical protein [unclassified Roseovarius]